MTCSGISKGYGSINENWNSESLCLFSVCAADDLEHERRGAVRNLFLL